MSINHSLVYHEGQVKTCTTIGWEPYYTCNNCSYSTYVELPIGHTYAGYWSYDANYHWHKALCEHTSEEKDRGEHVFNGDGECTACHYFTNGYTNGLQYELLEDGTYAVASIGDATDTDIKIPKNYNGVPVTKIGGYAFASSNIVSVTIPAGVKNIANQAFYLSKVKTVTFEEGSQLKTIGAQAFSPCENLETISIPSSVEIVDYQAIDYSVKLNEYNNGLYVGNAENPYLILVGVKSNVETSYTIHEDCKVISGAFTGCSNLKEIIIPNGVYSVSMMTFNGCSSLVKIVIPNSVIKLGHSTFSTCTALSEIVYTGSISEWVTLITNSDNWKYNENSKLYYVTCSDGLCIC